MRRALNALTALAAVLVAAASLAGALRLWSATDSLPGITRTTSVLTGMVEPGPAEIRLTAALPIKSTHKGVINAPSWSGGTVTWVSPKKVVANGDDLIEVNGQRAILCAGPIPVYRPLRIGATGGDVATVRSCLGIPGSGPVVRGTLEALAERLGLTDPRTGRLAAGVEELPTSRLVWAAKAPVRIDHINAVVGASAPAAGSPLATLASQTVPGRLNVEGLSAADAAMVLGEATKATFTSGAVTARVGKDLAVSSTGTNWSAVMRSIGAGAAVGAEAPSTEGDPAGSPGDEGREQPNPTLQGSLALTFASTAVIANSALYASPEGHACLAVRESHGWIGKEVAPVAFGWGQSLVDRALLGKVVALNPQALGSAKPACSP